MGRVLTVAHARVAPSREAEYQAVLRQLESRLGARGLHFWLFRSQDDPERFLEFTEGGATAGPRGVDAGEAELEARLRDVARYDAGASARWDAVPLGNRGE